MGRPANIQKDASMEETILAAAEKLFLQKGFALTSTTEIARVVGCNQALVHYYFRTKEQLFVSIFQYKIQLFATKFLDIYTPGTPFEDIICGMVDAHFDILGENPQLPGLILTEIMTNPARIKALRESLGELPVQLFARVSEELNAQIADGRVRQMEPRDLLMDLISLDAMPFIARPIIKGAFGFKETEYRKLLKERRESAKRTLLNSLRP
jgi:AcrR family transcriptional regulator